MSSETDADKRVIRDKLAIFSHESITKNSFDKNTLNLGILGTLNQPYSLVDKLANNDINNTFYLKSL